jgi:phage gp46-like protein
MTDVLMTQTPDGGECTIFNGQMAMSEGLETAAFLSCFGGNIKDSGLDADRALEWWGNKSETDPNLKYRSQLQHELSTRPLTPANLSIFEDAASADLAWFTDSVADSVAVVATMPAINTVNVNVFIEIDGVTTPFTFKSTPTAQ